MTDLTNNQRVAQEIENLTEAFEKQAASSETTEQIADAFLEYVLQRERIRRDVIAPGPSQQAVDAETLKKLQTCQLDDPKLVEAEAVLRRFGNNPIDGMRYFKRLVSNRHEELSKKMSKIAKRPRPEAQRVFTEIIAGFVSREPNLTSKELIQKFRTHQDFDVQDNEIIHITERDVMKITALPMALSRAKKN